MTRLALAVCLLLVACAGPAADVTTTTTGSPFRRSRPASRQYRSSSRTATSHRHLLRPVESFELLPTGTSTGLWTWPVSPHSPDALTAGMPDDLPQAEPPSSAHPRPTVSPCDDWPGPDPGEAGRRPGRSWTWSSRRRSKAPTGPSPTTRHRTRSPASAITGSLRPGHPARRHQRCRVEVRPSGTDMPAADRHDPRRQPGKGGGPRAR